MPSTHTQPGHTVSLMQTIPALKKKKKGKTHNSDSTPPSGMVHKNLDDWPTLSASFLNPAYLSQPLPLSFHAANSSSSWWLAPRLILLKPWQPYEKSHTLRPPLCEEAQVSHTQMPGHAQKTLDRRAQTQWHSPTWSSWPSLAVQLAPGVVPLWSRVAAFPAVPCLTF